MTSPILKLIPFFGRRSGITLIPIVLLAASCGPKQQGPLQLPPIAVTVQAAESKNPIYYDEYPATITALSQVELRAQVNGYITGIFFSEGSHVTKGQKLYTIDQQAAEAAYMQAAANVAVQKANLMRATKDVERYRELIKRDAISKQQADNAEAAYEAATKQVLAAEAAMESVQTNVRYSTILAPLDGTIGISMVRLGAAVSAGQTLLNTVSTDNPIGADIAIDQKEIYRFTQLHEKHSAAGDSTIRLVFNGEIYPYPGKISFIDRAVNAQTGTIVVRMVFQNSSNLLRVGMTGTVRVLNSGTQKLIVIPYKAVTEQLGEYFVYVVKPDSNKVSQHRVVLGKQVNRNVIILKGLKEGETIVTEGVQSLREGSIVAPGPATEAKTP